MKKSNQFWSKVTLPFINNFDKCTIVFDCLNQTGFVKKYMKEFTGSCSFTTFILTSVYVLFSRAVTISFLKIAPYIVTKELKRLRFMFQS